MIIPGYRPIARTATRDCSVALHQRRGHFVITSCDQVLMSSEDTGSERALGRLAGQFLRGVRRPRVLVGGLGMGFTLRALLDRLPRNARVVVAELLPPVVRWNHERLGSLAAHPLEDARVQLHIGDVIDLLRGQPAWDAIVLDLDNGPEWIVQERNQTLYGRRGLTRLLGSLRPGGLLALWSAGRNRLFERRLAAMGLRARRFRRAARPESAMQPFIYVVSPPGPATPERRA